MEFTLEECTDGGWKTRFDFNELADTIRDNVDLDVDTDHMLLWHQDGVKLSFVKSSGVMTIRTDDKEHAADLVRHAIGDT